MTRPTLTAAIGHARRIVSAIEPKGQRQYCVRVYDQKQRAWHESQSLNYGAALARRKADLVEQALLFLGYDFETADSVGWNSHADVGPWHGTVSRHVKKHPL